MSKENQHTRTRSAALNKDGVILAAIKLADADGIEALSMRKLGRELGVEAMALYYHFANKNQLIEGMIDHIHGEIEAPTDSTNWMNCMRKRAQSAFEVLSRHPWAAALMEAGVTPGPATLHDSERMIKCFREAGFSIEMTVHAVTVLNIYIYGAAAQFAKLSFSTPDQAAEVSQDIQRQFPVDSYPYLGEMISEHMMQAKYNPVDEFNFGLSLILDGILRYQPSK